MTNNNKFWQDDIYAFHLTNNGYVYVTDLADEVFGPAFPVTIVQREQALAEISEHYTDVLGEEILIAYSPEERVRIGAIFGLEVLFR